MANHLQPTITSTYANFVTEMDARFDDLAVGLDPAVTTATNVPTNSIRWSGASNKWQKYNGSAWNDLAATYAIAISGNAGTVTNGVYTNATYANPAFITSLTGSKITGDISGNAGSATQLATARNINGVPFNGTAAISVNLNNSVTFNNGGSGAASGNAFNGSSSLTVSYNTVGAPSTTGVNASGTWAINISGNAGTSSVANDISANVFAKIYPIGSIYINAGVDTNPAILLGFGTWVAFGAGRVMVGLNTSDVLFDTLEETGGSKDATLVSHSHTGSTNSAGAATGSISTGNPGDFGALRDTGTGVLTGANYNGNRPQGAAGGGSYHTLGINIPNHNHTVTIDSNGSSATNANLQPYITVCMWKRTA